ncbi:serine/threonine protein kinase [Synechocystis sp. PCC 7509]|uniref:serine/threonine protein kinase n=1 Tax=Synechocystis sp. PCC 7509 TaxID=927677 RepID=UPI0002AC82DC|nr:serine/threonine protein kinase [Synechocystis sp. PCC 7509]
MQGIILRGRYRITKLLGRGGFGDTYLAADGDRPGKPICVVKKLQVNSNSPSILQAAQRLFNNEAEILYKLGSHEQIPQLLAHFEEDNQFYLVQEFIDGHDLSEEINPNRQWSEKQIEEFLREVLTILKFVHEQNVIHRDIKPSNLIRRKRDGKIFLIDFGVVKEIQLPTTTQINSYATISVGTPGYVPNEQLGGKPRFSSDIYALGITAIQALTGLYPEQIAEHPQTGELLWQQSVEISDRLAAILTKMVKSHFRDRYQFIDEVLADLQNFYSHSRKFTSVSDTPKNSVSTPSLFVPEQLKESTRKSETSSPQLISFPILIGLIAATIGATFYLSRWLLPPQIAQTIVTKETPKVNFTPTPTSEVARVRSPAATSTPPLISPSPKVALSPVAPKLPETATLPEILSPTITTKISPEANLATPTALPVPLEQVTQPIPLTEVKCLTTSADSNNQSFVESLANLTIGKETVTAIAELASQNSRNPIDSQIKADTPAGVDCLLNPRDTNNQFNTLKLAFGINDTNKYLSNTSAGTKVRLTVYLDQKSIGSKEVTKGEIKTWGVNIADVENVALEAECIKSSNISNTCPALVFTQVDLN